MCLTPNVVCFLQAGSQLCQDCVLPRISCVFFHCFTHCHKSGSHLLDLILTSLWHSNYLVIFPLLNQWYCNHWFCVYFWIYVQTYWVFSPLDMVTVWCFWNLQCVMLNKKREWSLSSQFSSYMLHELTQAVGFLTKWKIHWCIKKRTLFSHFTASSSLTIAPLLTWGDLLKLWRG